MSRAQTVRYVLHAKRTSAAGGRVEAYWLRWRGLPQGRSNQRCPPSPALRPLLIRRPRWILNSAAVCVCACVCEGAMQRPNHRAVHTGSPRGKERTWWRYLAQAWFSFWLIDWKQRLAFQQERRPSPGFSAVSLRLPHPIHPVFDYSVISV